MVFLHETLLRPCLAKQDPKPRGQTSKRLPFRRASAMALPSRTGLWGVGGYSSGSRVLQRRLRQMEKEWQALAMRQVRACLHATECSSRLHPLKPQNGARGLPASCVVKSRVKEPAMLTRQSRKWECTLGVGSAYLRTLKSLLLIHLPKLGR